MDRRTEKLIRKHRIVYKLEKCVRQLELLATQQYRLIDLNPNVSSRTIERQKLKYDMETSIREVVEVAVVQVQRIDFMP